MRRFLSVGIGIALTTFIAVSATGFYPVVNVEGGGVILARTWKKAEGAAIRFANAELISRGERPLDFSSPEQAELLVGVRRDTLTFLIEDAILAREGARIVSDFNRLSRARVREALRDQGNLEQGVKLLYGLSLGDFQKLVLLPQARRDLARESFEARGQSFEEWFRTAKQSERVRLFFTPFRWSGEQVE